MTFADGLSWLMSEKGLWVNLDLGSFCLRSLAGGLAAAGFGVLFNFAPRDLVWCLGAGILAVATRSLAMGLGLSLEGASFLAAVTVGLAVQLPHRRNGLTRTALAAAACTSMIPGGAIARAILGLFSLTTEIPSPAYLSMVVHDILLSVFTLIAIGVGVSLSLQVFRRRGLDL